MELVLHDKKYRIKNSDIIGILIDFHLVKEKNENICVLESDERNSDGEFPLYDVWERDLEEA